MKKQDLICPKCHFKHGLDIQRIWDEKEYITCYRCEFRIYKEQNKDDYSESLGDSYETDFSELKDATD